MLDFTIPRGDERLTKGGAESAVHGSNGPAIGEARLKHASFNRTRAVSVARLGAFRRR
jgi:hypothetical protein